jgi:hypothetical protein
MHGAAFVTRTLMDQLSAPMPAAAPCAPAPRGPSILGRLGHDLLLRIDGLLARLRHRVAPVPDLAAQLERLAETAPHLLLDIGVDPETRLLIVAADGPAVISVPAPEPAPEPAPRPVARPHPARRVVRVVPPKPARGWRLVPPSRRARLPRRLAPAFDL